MILTSPLITSLSHRLATHPLYAAVTTRAALQVFTEHHVFAVWYFMSLLKTLQASLTCVRVPWTPPASGQLSYLINTIVLGEESDRLPDGTYGSHFELYLAAMREIGARTAVIDTFVGMVEQGTSVEASLAQASAPGPATRFIASTFAILSEGHTHATAAAFTCGHEDLVPRMFRQVASHTSILRPTHPAFFYYLDRHIELDSDSHGPLAREMLQTLCNGDEQRIRESVHAVERSLMARVHLWDGVHEAILAS